MSGRVYVDDDGVGWLSRQRLYEELGFSSYPEMVGWLTAQWWWLQEGVITRKSKLWYHPKYVEQCKALLGIPNDLGNRHWLDAWEGEANERGIRPDDGIAPGTAQPRDRAGHAGR